MGNTASKYTAVGKLSAELPPVKKMGHDENWSYVDLSMKVFSDDKDREQFIHAILAVATSNGQLDLSGADYKLFYSRRQRPYPTPTSPTPSSRAIHTSVSGQKAEEVDDGSWLIASIAALREGRIIAKIEPALGGADQREAFLALRRDIEVRLDRILQSVPSAVGGDEAGPSAPRTQTQGEVPGDMPPSYQSSAVGMVPQKEKA